MKFRVYFTAHSDLIYIKINMEREKIVIHQISNLRTVWFSRRTKAALIDWLYMIIIFFPLLFPYIVPAEWFLDKAMYCLIRQCGFVNLLTPACAIRCRFMCTGGQYRRPVQAASWLKLQNHPIISSPRNISIAAWEF